MATFFTSRRKKKRENQPLFSFLEKLFVSLHKKIKKRYAQKRHTCVYSLSLFQIRSFSREREQVELNARWSGWKRRSRLVLLRRCSRWDFSFFFFPRLRRENHRLFLPRAREKCAARWGWVCFIWWDAKIRTGGCDCFCIVVNVFVSDVMVVSWCGGVLRTPTTRRRTRDFGPKRKDLFGTVCCANVFCNKKRNKKQNTNLFFSLLFQKTTEH